MVLVKAKPMIYRLFFLVPLGCGLYFIFCWAKVHILMDQKSFSTACNYFFSGLRLLLSHQENKNKRGHRQKFVCYEVSTNVILCESDSYKVLSKVLKFALSTRLKFSFARRFPSKDAKDHGFLKISKTIRSLTKVKGFCK